MPISATGSMIRTADIGSVARSDRGFSLVEVMVVLVIMGLLAGVVTVNLPDPADDQRALVERLAAKIKVTADEAILSGQVTGIEITERGYRALVRRRGLWEISTDRLAGALPKQMRPVLTVEGEDRALASRSVSAIDRAPTLMFTPSAEFAPFELRFESPRGSLSITGAADGTIRFAEGGQ